MRSVLIIILTLLLTRAAPLPPAPTVAAGPFSAPACRDSILVDAAALLVALSGAGYDCAEQLAHYLVAAATPTIFWEVLAASASDSSPLERRNALRVIGRYAEAPPGSNAHILAHGQHAAEVRIAVITRLERETHEDPLNDAIWIADTFYAPWFETQPMLERISAEVYHPPFLRARAALAAGRLIYARAGPARTSDLAYARAALNSDAPGVRDAGAQILMRYADSQLTDAARTANIAVLDAAWSAIADPTAAIMPPAGLDLEQRRDIVALEAAQVAAVAALARARDRYSGGTAQLDYLRERYRARHLPKQYARAGLVLRSTLPISELQRLADLVAQVDEQFRDLVGPELAAPLPGEAVPELTIDIFGNQAAYRGYLAAFAAIPFEIDGVYRAEWATISTAVRTPQESRNTLEETVRHEVTHVLAGQALFPGAWFDPGYHAEPRGWADEGLAEVLAQTQPRTADGLSPPPARHLGQLCRSAALPPLGALLSQRAGYDRFGVFDYPAAWAFSSYLLNERREVALRIYTAFRTGNYRLADFEQISGVPIAALEQDWHTAIRSWCRTAAG